MAKDIQGQTILVRKTITLQKLGLGHKNDMYSLNFSHELHFTRRAGACVYQTWRGTSYYNFRALSPLKETYSED